MARKFHAAASWVCENLDFGESVREIKVIKIAICDDDIKVLEYVAELLKKLEGCENYHHSLRAFSSSVQLLELLEKGEEFDLFFLDVVMPEVNGIALGEYISKNNSKAKIIYLSASKEFAVESYMVNAFYYMLKPVEMESFYKVATRVLNVINIENSVPHYVAVETSNGKVAVEFDNIMYCLLENRRVKYYLADGSATVESKMIRCSFDEEMVELIETAKFGKCSAHCVVNLAKIQNIESEKLTMKNGEVMRISRGLKQQLNNAYFDYYFKNSGGGTK